MSLKAIFAFTVAISLVEISYAQSALVRCDASTVESTLRSEIVKELALRLPEADPNSIEISFSNYGKFRSKDKVTYDEGSSLREVLTGVYKLNVQVNLKSGQLLKLYDHAIFYEPDYRLEPVRMMLKTKLSVFRRNGVTKVACTAQLNERHSSSKKWYVVRTQPPFDSDKEYPGVFYLSFLARFESSDFDPNQSKAIGDCDDPYTFCHNYLQPGQIEDFSPVW